MLERIRSLYSKVPDANGCSIPRNRTTQGKVFNLQVPETLPEGVLEKIHAPPKPDVPIVDVHDLPTADGFVFAFPTRCTSSRACFYFS